MIELPLGEAGLRYLEERFREYRTLSQLVAPRLTELPGEVVALVPEGTSSDEALQFDSHRSPTEGPDIPMGRGVMRKVRDDGAIPAMARLIDSALDEGCLALAEDNLRHPDGPGFSPDARNPNNIIHPDWIHFGEEIYYPLTSGATTGQIDEVLASVANPWLANLAVLRPPPTFTLPSVGGEVSSEMVEELARSPIMLASAIAYKSDGYVVWRARGT